MIIKTQNVIEEIIKAEKKSAESIGEAKRIAEERISESANILKGEIYRKKEEIENDFKDRYTGAIETAEYNSQRELDEIKERLNILCGDNELCDSIKKHIIQLIFQ